MIYPVQSIARLSVQFTLADGVTEMDPTTVSVAITAPDGSQQVVGATVRDGTGAYHYDLTVGEAGTYTYRWQGLGAVVAATLPRELIGV